MQAVVRHDGLPVAQRAALSWQPLTATINPGLVVLPLELTVKYLPVLVHYMQTLREIF